MKVNEFFGINDNDLAIMAFYLSFNDRIRDEIYRIMVVADNDIKKRIAEIDELCLNGNQLLQDMVIIEILLLTENTKKYGGINNLADRLLMYFPIDVVKELVENALLQIRNKDIPPVSERIEEYHNKWEEIKNQLKQNYSNKVRSSYDNAGTLTTTKSCEGCGITMRIDKKTKDTELCKKCRKK